uniref:Uncharacterized protein n=1 Tax=Oryza meridionalis TaxID=40149 RepID=A0A0E0CJJ2_9ORYZ
MDAARYTIINLLDILFYRSRAGSCSAAAVVQQNARRTASPPLPSSTSVIPSIPAAVYGVRMAVAARWSAAAVSGSQVLGDVRVKTWRRSICSTLPYYIALLYFFAFGIFVS